MNAEQALTTFRTSSTGWTKSSFSTDGECVEVNLTIPGWVGVRDSKDPDRQNVLLFSRVGWAGVLAAVREGSLSRRSAANQYL